MSPRSFRESTFLDGMSQQELSDLITELEQEILGEDNDT